MPSRIKFNRRAGEIVLNKVAKGMQVIGEEVAVNAKGSMRRMPFPSQPGKPPRIDTGKLVASIGTETRKSQNKVETRVGTDVDYGRYLETGTSKMKARPWLRPAFRKVKNQYRRK